MTPPERLEEPGPEELGQLEELADLFGVQTANRDTAGRPRSVASGTVLAILRSLGAELDPEVTAHFPGPAAEQAVADALRAERLRQHRLVVEPVLAVRTGRRSGGTAPVAVALPRHLHPRDCWLTLEEEGGRVHRTRLLPAISRPLPGGAVEGERVDRYEVPVSREPLPAGYHRLTVEGPDLQAECLVVVAPTCPEPARGWGAFLPLYALRTGTDWGVGNFGDLARLAEWIGDLGGDFVGTLPLYPAFLDGDPEGGPPGGPPIPAEPSPYRPVSRLGWNELYVDPTVLPELATTPAARDLLASDAFRAELQSAQGSLYVDYRPAMARVRRVLAPMAESLFAAGPPARREAMEAFARAHPELVAYARFRSAVAAGRRPERDDRRPLDTEARYHLYAQWVAAEQLAAAGDQLYLDLPVGVHPDGFDPWWEPGAFVEGVEGGAPPDAFFAGGQRWGFRPLHPRGIRDDGYRYPIACLRHLMARAAVVRIDHVMGLHRLYWVPDGRAATEGAYVRYRADELRAVVALEAHRAGTAVVGEDLGTVPEGVREGMAEDRMLRSWVFEFAATPADPLPEPPEPVLASLATHDLPRFATWWEESGRAEEPGPVGGLSAGAALATSLEHLAGGPARLLMVDLEDLWGERRPQNRPGTNYGNWENRSLRTLDEMAGDRPAAELLRDLDGRRHGAPGAHGHGAPGAHGHGAPGAHGHGAPGAEGDGAPGAEGDGASVDQHEEVGR